MGAPVGPERYLRLLAERALLDGQHRPPTGSALERAAAALAGAGVLGGEVAHRVVEEYGLAAAVRGRLPPDWRNYVGVPGSTATVELRPPTVVPGPIDVALPVADLTILWVRFGDEDTVIGVIAMLAMGIPAGGPPSLQVADDRGTSGTATLGNVRGSGDGRFQVTFTTVPLSAKTAWLELNGRRVVLPARRPSGAQVLIEPVPSRSSALGYLWHEAAVSVDPLPRPRDTTASIEALVAVGAVDPSDPELQAVRDVSAALGGRARRAGPATREPGESVGGDGADRSRVRRPTGGRT